MQQTKPARSYQQTIESGQLLDIFHNLYKFCNNTKKEIGQNNTTILKNKINKIHIKITQQLTDKIKQYQRGNITQRQYNCHICSKKFKQGRQLGGHISRAHKIKK